MKKILILTTVNSTINAFLIPHIQDLKSKGFFVECAANVNSDIDARLLEDNIMVHNIQFSRNPFSKSNLKAFRNLIKLQKENNYDVIFTHTPVASIYARLVKLKLKSIKIMYMAHGFHFYKGAPIINWLVYYPIEKMCSYLTDVLITINTEDYELAKKKMKSKKVYYIPGVGFDTDKFSNTKVDRIQKRKELGINEDDIMLLSVGELSKRKNHEIIIKALYTINNKNIHYFIAGVGELENYLRELSEKLGLQENIHFLSFRKDTNELYKVANIFCFPSKQEGLPVALMEAMASGLPVICSDIRGNRDLVKDKVNGFLCDLDSIDDLKTNIENLIDNKTLIDKFRVNNQSDILKFDIKNVINEMERIYIKNI